MSEEENGALMFFGKLQRLADVAGPADLIEPAFAIRWSTERDPLLDFVRSQSTGTRAKDGERREKKEESFHAARMRPASAAGKDRFQGSSGFGAGSK